MNDLIQQKTHMDQSDIKEIINLITDAHYERNWESIEDVIETLKEFLDDTSVEADDLL